MTTFPKLPPPHQRCHCRHRHLHNDTRVILFQYNPETLTLRLQAWTSGEGGNKSEALRLEGAPEKTISLDIEIDATDHLEKAKSNAVSMGIHSLTY